MTGNKNVVLLTVDSLRADYCSFLNAEWDLTPRLDGMADEGVVYENAIAPGPRTPSSMPETFTGEIAPTVAVDEVTWGGRWDRIRKHLHHHRTIADRFQNKGYTTIGLTPNPWTHGTGFDNGFDKFVPLKATSEATDGVEVPLGFRLLDRTMQVGDLQNRFRWYNKREWFAQWPQHYRRISEEIHQASEPFFVWIFLLDTHLPYIVPKEFRDETSAVSMYYTALRQFRRSGEESLPDHVESRLRQSYRDAVRSVDTFVDRVWSEFGNEDTLLLFHSDHGEAFGEHDTFGHQSAVYEENLRIPLLAHNVGATGRVDAPVSLRELPEMAVDAAFDDRSFEPARYASDGFVYAGTEGGGAHTLRGNRWKFILNGAKESLYDLVKDPGERRDASGRRRDIVENLAGQLEQPVMYRREQSLIADAVGELVNTG